jgi:hypothetical protein
MLAMMGAANETCSRVLIHTYSLFKFVSALYFLAPKILQSIAIFAYTYHQMLKRKSFELTSFLQMQSDAIMARKG